MVWTAFFASLLCGGAVACMVPAWGAVVSVSIMGAFILHSLEKERSAAMSEYLHIYKDKTGISLRLDTGHEKPASIGRPLGTVLTGADWEALLQYYLRTNEPEILEAVRSSASEPGGFRVLFAPDAEEVVLRCEKTFRSLIEDGTELRRLLREEYDEIWPEEDE